MFIRREIYELDLQNAYEDGNNDATKMWQKEFELQREYYQEKLIELRESIKTTKKDDLVEKINGIIKGNYRNYTSKQTEATVHLELNGKKMWECIKEIKRISKIVDFFTVGNDECRKLFQYDFDNKKLLVSEKYLMHLIRMVNPQEINSDYKMEIVKEIKNDKK